MTTTRNRVCQHLPAPTTCSPSRISNFRSHGTCYSEEDVRQLVDMYNSHQSTPEASKIESNASVSSLLESLRKRLNTEEGQDSTWMDMPFVVDQDDKYRMKRRLETGFRPKMPHSWKANTHTWLTNRDIANVMDQYEEYIPDFSFIGVFPRDFELRLPSGQCVSQKMCDLDLPDMLKRGKRHLGTVFNLDTHLGGGSHWVSLYASIDHKRKDYGVYYYDSVARAPPTEVHKFMMDMKGKMDALNVDKPASFQVKHNTVRRQFENTECGIFVMFFLVCCMSRRLDFDRICECMGLDDHIHELRRIFFR